MRHAPRRYQPNSIEDLDRPENGAYRPGPIQGGMIDDFIDRKHGRKKIEHELPELQEILQETLGVIVIRSRHANRETGLLVTGRADLLRRAMEKIASEMAAQRERFVTGANQRGDPLKEDRKYFRSDGAIRRLTLVSRSALRRLRPARPTRRQYWKTRYPVEFMAALLTSVTGSTDVVKHIMNAAKWELLL